MKRIIFIIIGLILSATAVAMLNSYLNSEREKIANELRQAFTEQYKNMVSVIMAKVDIPRGTELSPHMLAMQPVPDKYVQPEALTSLEGVAGTTTIAPIMAGEQVTRSKLTAVSSATPETREKTLSSITPAGKRAITITVDNISGLVGMIKPGDYVDVAALMDVPVQNPDGSQGKQPATVPLFQNVLILAVGNQFYKKEGGMKKFWQSWGKEEENKSQSPTDTSPLITLALNPDEANLTSFVQQNGKLQLMLRSPTDAQVKQTPVASWDTLFEHLNKNAPSGGGTQQQSRVTPAPSPIKPLDNTVKEPDKTDSNSEPKRIEIYRGANKESIPVVP